MAAQPLQLTARQVTAICKGASKAGCIAELDLGKGVIVRLVPEHLSTTSADYVRRDRGAHIRL